MYEWEKHYQNWQTELSALKEITPDMQNIGAHNKAIAQLESKCSVIEKFNSLNQKLGNAKENSKNETDAEMKALWDEEIANIERQLPEAESSIIDSLVSSKNENVILEIRSGEGGQEASIFSLELVNMYIKLCKKKNWQFKTFSISYSDSDAIKEGMFEISGPGVSSWLAMESGVHCVKRVPKTEKKGRTHTSTATVAVLEEPEDVEVILNDKDLKIDVFRSSGPGGQSVNTTDSAVRITHLPTGIVVSQQDEKSQHKNKEKAMKILKARIYQQKLDEAHEAHALTRKNAIGRAKRNERIRTYHFSQNWINDSRVEKMCHNVSAFMEGDALADFLNILIWRTIE